MKKLLFLTAIAGIFTFSTVKAQDAAMSGPKLGVGAEFAFPVGKLADGTKLGYGGSLTYQHPIADKLNLTGNAGYLNFQGKDFDLLGVTYKGVNTGYIPVKAGLRYFLAENIYVGGELGAVFATGDGDNGTAFAYSPGIGVEFPVADKSTIELGGRYEGWSNNGTASFVGLRLAWNFGL